MRFPLGRDASPNSAAASPDFADHTLAQSLARTSSESTSSPLWRIVVKGRTLRSPTTNAGPQRPERRRLFAPGVAHRQHIAQNATTIRAKLKQTNKQSSANKQQSNIKQTTKHTNCRTCAIVDGFCRRDLVSQRAVGRELGQQRPTALTITITEGQSQWLHQAYPNSTPDATSQR